MPKHLVVFGLGYTGAEIARAAAARGLAVTVVTRRPGAAPESLAASGIALAPFDAPPLAGATHLVTTAPPGERGDPVLAAHRDAIVAAHPSWIGYLSTTGVYGDRGGDWVDELSEPRPSQPRSLRRREAEQAWEETAAAAGAALDLIRLGGIYGPGRSPLDELRAGTARRVVKPGQIFSRIHVADIADLVLAAIARPPASPVRVLHGVDDMPAPPDEVVAEAARLLGLPPPPAIAFEAAKGTMSPMALSFWSENRKVANTLTRAATGWRPRHPSWREGLAAILAAEGSQAEA